MTSITALQSGRVSGLAIGLLVCAVACLNTGCGAVRTKPPSSPAVVSSPSAADFLGVSEEELRREMKKYLGIPYRRGGSSLKETDCSGLIRQMYGDIFGLELPHNSKDQYALPFLKDVTEDSLKAGDLVFFGASRKRISHVGAYLADGTFIHASPKAGVIVSRLDNPYWRKRFVGCRRLILPSI
jgi:cell wall-associated NlpC family hydrolase